MMNPKEKEITVKLLKSRNQGDQLIGISLMSKHLDSIEEIIPWDSEVSSRAYFMNVSGIKGYYPLSSETNLLFGDASIVRIPEDDRKIGYSSYVKLTLENGEFLIKE